MELVSIPARDYHSRRRKRKNAPVTTLLTEIQEQPEVLRRCINYYRIQESALSRSLQRQSQSPVTFTGMGASLRAAVPAVYYLNARGIAAGAIETAELVYYRLQILSECEWLVVISQSGETIEIERLLARLRGRRPRLAAITDNPQSLLAQRADYVLPLCAGPQRFASTKTYSASVFVALLLAALWGEGRMRGLVNGLARHLESYEKLLGEAHQQARTLADTVRKDDHVVLLGRGPNLASALEGALLFKEVCARPAEGMTGAEFRHGPLELLARPLAVVLFAPRDPALPLNRRLRAQLLRYRARVVWISAQRDSARGAQLFHLPRLSLPAITPLFEIVPVQFLTWELARRAGREPGRLRIARNVTRQE